MPKDLLPRALWCCERSQRDAETVRVPRDSFRLEESEMHSDDRQLSRRRLRAAHTHLPLVLRAEALELVLAGRESLELFGQLHNHPLRRHAVAVGAAFRAVPAPTATALFPEALEALTEVEELLLHLLRDLLLLVHQLRPTKRDQTTKR